MVDRLRYILDSHIESRLTQPQKLEKFIHQVRKQQVQHVCMQFL